MLLELGPFRSPDSTANPNSANVTASDMPFANRHCPFRTVSWVERISLARTIFPCHIGDFLTSDIARGFYMKMATLSFATIHNICAVAVMASILCRSTVGAQSLPQDADA
jgi:hypothetical protein